MSTPRFLLKSDIYFFAASENRACASPHFSHCRCIPPPSLPSLSRRERERMRCVESTNLSPAVDVP